MYNALVAKEYVQFSEQVRRAVRTCGFTKYRISQETGIDQATLSRFMSGERGLPMKTLDRLAKFLRLWITIEGPHKGRKGKT